MKELGNHVYKHVLYTESVYFAFNHFQSFSLLNPRGTLYEKSNRVNYYVHVAVTSNSKLRKHPRYNSWPSSWRDYWWQNIYEFRFWLKIFPFIRTISNVVWNPCTSVYNIHRSVFIYFFFFCESCQTFCVSSLIRIIYA